MSTVLTWRDRQQRIARTWSAWWSAPSHRATVFAFVGCAAAAAAGWLAFNDTQLIHHDGPGDASRGFVLAALVLALLWRGVNRRWQGPVLMAGWYAGSTAAIPFIWREFFGAPAWPGWVVWLALCLVLAAPYALAPRRWPRLGLLIGSVLTVVPPLGLIGMASPLLAAGNLFPGWGWMALGLGLLFFFLSGLLKKSADVLALLMAVWGIAHVGQPAPAVPDGAWGMVRFDGPYPTDLIQGFARQDALKAEVRQALRDGARLIVLPEGANPQWDAGAIAYWQDIATLARQKNAQVLIGVYTDGLVKNDKIDGLYDLTTGRTYPAAVTMPIAMWKPWVGRQDVFKENFPLRLNHANVLPTPYGRAAYSICYENTLLWPTLVAAWHQPSLLIGAANQWFAVNWLGVAQHRSLRMQARLFGWPLIAAVNGPDPDARGS